MSSKFLKLRFQILKISIHIVERHFKFQMQLQTIISKSLGSSGYSSFSSNGFRKAVDIPKHSNGLILKFLNSADTDRRSSMRTCFCNLSNITKEVFPYIMCEYRKE